MVSPLASQAAQQARGEDFRGARLVAKFWRVGIQIRMRLVSFFGCVRRFWRAWERRAWWREGMRGSCCGKDGGVVGMRYWGMGDGCWVVGRVIISMV